MARKDVMIDLETMGLRPTSAIVSIGAVHFDKTAIISEFYTSVSLSSCLALGLTTDQSTVDWWQKQSVEARMAWQRDDAPPLSEALSMFTDWLRKVGPDKQICPWGNGSDFDLTLLGNAHAAIGADTYWRYYNHHCFRTMKNIFPVAPVIRAGTHHNALDDAKHQVLHLQRILQVHKIDLL